MLWGGVQCICTWPSPANHATARGEALQRMSHGSQPVNHALERPQSRTHTTGATSCSCRTIHIQRATAGAIGRAWSA